MSEKVFAIVLLIGVAVTAAINAFKPTPPTEQPAPEVTATTSTVAKPQEVAVVSVPSELPPDIAPGAPDVSQVSAVTPPPAKPLARIPATATGRAYSQPVYQMPRRRLFGRRR